MIHWTRQIKEVLSSQDGLQTAENAGPLEEIEFWKNRCADLSGISDQLDKPGVKRITHILELAKSSYVAPFLRLSGQIKVCAYKYFIPTYYTCFFKFVWQQSCLFSVFRMAQIKHRATSSSSQCWKTHVMTWQTVIPKTSLLCCQRFSISSVWSGSTQNSTNPGRGWQEFSER